jgi:hypothetical protein
MAKVPCLTAQELKAQTSKIVKFIESIQKRRMLHTVVFDLKELERELKLFMFCEYERYETKFPTCAEGQKCFEDIRGAIYTMVHVISQKNIKVNVTDVQHQTHMQNIKSHLRAISKIMNDDCIDLCVDMDTSNDEMIARRLHSQM